MVEKYNCDINISRAGPTKIWLLSRTNQKLKKKKGRKEENPLALSGATSVGDRGI